MDNNTATDFFSSEIGNTWFDKDIISILLKRYPTKIAPILEKIYDFSLSAQRIAKTIEKECVKLPKKNVLIIGVELPDRYEDMRKIEKQITKTRNNFVFDTIQPFGSGKFEHLNAILKRHDLSKFDWLIVTDDDVDIPDNFVDHLICVLDHYNFKIGQPAHNFISYTTYTVTRRQFNSIARVTNFVEIGPIFAFHRDVFSELLPFPDVGMGWGLDIHWSFLANKKNWRMGVVDALPIRHLRPVGSGYKAKNALEAAGFFLKEYEKISRQDILRTKKIFSSWN